MSDPEEDPEVDPKEEQQEPTPEPEAEEVITLIDFSNLKSMSLQDEYFAKKLAEEREKQAKEAMQHLMSIFDEDPEPDPEPTPEEIAQKEREDQETEEAIRQMREALGIKKES